MFWMNENDELLWHCFRRISRTDSKDLVIWLMVWIWLVIWTSFLNHLNVKMTLIWVSWSNSWFLLRIDYGFIWELNRILSISIQHSDSLVLSSFSSLTVSDVSVNMNLIVLVVDITFRVFCDDWWMYYVIEIIQNKNLVFLHHCYLWWEDIEPACYVLVMGLIDVICSILWNYWWMNSLFVMFIKISSLSRETYSLWRLWNSFSITLHLFICVLKKEENCHQMLSLIIEIKWLKESLMTLIENRWDEMW